ncbi:MAG: response regulator transcription factor [Deltaproteobacteria bacterium]|nr:response regulator transcription factor [Deltaproteobacteria bacterium]
MQFAEVPKPYTILIVDDHFVARCGLRGLFETQPDLHVVAESNDGESAVLAYREHKPDLVTMDARMPRLNGSAATRQILKDDPDARILFVSSFDSESDVRAALAAGARGYLTKSAEPTELLTAVRTVARGERYVPRGLAEMLARAEEPHLSQRERKLLTLIARGLSNRYAALELGLSAGSVRIYASQLFGKLGVKKRGELVAIALQRGLIEANREDNLAPQNTLGPTRC